MSEKEHGFLFTESPPTPTVSVGELENTFVAFSDSEGEVGKLEMKDGKIFFTGNPDESAQIFFDAFKYIVDGYIERICNVK